MIDKNKNKKNVKLHHLAVMIIFHGCIGAPAQILIHICFDPHKATGFLIIGSTSFICWSQMSQN